MATELSQAIRDVARQLGVSPSGAGDLSERIVAACVRRVDGWCTELGPVDTFEDLLEVVAAKLRVHFETVRDDDELDEVQRRYLAHGETGFLDLRKEFDEYTDAIVIRMQRAPSWSDRQFVAVIDARGPKHAREWFSKWHELAHLIAEPQTKFVFRRTQATRRDPIERLMDQIASELGFYSRLLLPALKRQGIDLQRPRLKQLLAFRDAECASASLHSALIAVLRQCRVPAILVEAKVEHKPTEKRALAARRAPPKLRAVSTAHNTAATRAKFYIHRWMRVPPSSVISRVHDGATHEESKPVAESLAWWESEGKRLAPIPVTVEATSAGQGRVLALVQKA